MSTRKRKRPRPRARHPGFQVEWESALSTLDLFLFPDLVQLIGSYLFSIEQFIVKPFRGKFSYLDLNSQGDELILWGLGEIMGFNFKTQTISTTCFESPLQRPGPRPEVCRTQEGYARWIIRLSGKTSLFKGTLDRERNDFKVQRNEVDVVCIPKVECLNPDTEVAMDEDQGSCHYILCETRGTVTMGQIHPDGSSEILLRGRLKQKGFFMSVCISSSCRMACVAGVQRPPARGRSGGRSSKDRRLIIYKICF